MVLTYKLLADCGSLYNIEPVSCVYFDAVLQCILCINCLASNNFSHITFMVELVKFQNN